MHDVQIPGYRYNRSSLFWTCGQQPKLDKKHTSANLSFEAICTCQCHGHARRPAAAKPNCTRETHGYRPFFGCRQLNKPLTGEVQNFCTAFRE